MNRTRALNILGISKDAYPDDEIDEEQLKKSYRMKILQYHPDKKHSIEATEQFIEIQEAYAFLKKSNLDADDESKSYNEILREFLSRILEEEYAEMAVPFVTKIFDIVLSRIIKFIDSNNDKLSSYLENINRPVLLFIYNLFSKYCGIFHLPNGLLERIGEILQNEKMRNADSDMTTECLVLNPTLEDLFSDENVYKLKYENGTYFVPLWHHDIVFDHSGQDLLVKCFPVLPENMELDEWNNLTVELDYSVEDVWNQTVEVMIGGQTLKFDGRALCLTESPQTIVFKSCGVLHNNTNNIFDVSKKQDVILIIHLHL